MTDKKPTDNEIKKALEESVSFDEPYESDFTLIRIEYIKNALDLINRLQADNKELKYKVKKWKENYESSQVVVGDFREIINKQAEELKTAKAEAHKEFAYKLKQIPREIVYKNEIDNLSKELVATVRNCLPNNRIRSDTE